MRRCLTFNIFQRFTVASAVLIALMVASASPASAAPREALNPLIGSTYQQSIAPGVVLTFHQLNKVEAVAAIPDSIPRSALSGAQCPGAPYWCAWTGLQYSGTFAKYNMENVYANVANGVAHCWNLAAPMADNTDSWMNDSGTGNPSGARTAVVIQWQNCNTGGGFFNMVWPSFWDCRSYDGAYASWCYAATAQSSLYAGETYP